MNLQENGIALVYSKKYLLLLFNNMNLYEIGITFCILQEIGIFTIKWHLFTWIDLTLVYSKMTTWDHRLDETL